MSARQAEPAQIWWALSSVRGLGPKRMQKLAAALEEGRRGADSLVDAQASELMALGLSAAQAAEAEERLASPEAVPTTPTSVVLTPDDERYPMHRLTRGTPPLPAVLFCEGDLSLLASSSIAIVGSRNVAPSIVELAEAVAERSATDRVVVSGLAQGVDEAAHGAALSSGGSTIAVLAEGTDRSARARGALQQHEERLLVLSEFPPGTDWAPGRAMQRNATVAALADLVVVIASDVRGGTWEMGQLCIKNKKPLAVLDLDETSAPGNARLIKGGAFPIDTTSLELPTLGEPAESAPPESELSLFDL